MPHRPKIGLALGSGSARGWAHIGILRALADLDLQPDIVCGSSIGALVGGAYACGKLDALEEWVVTLDKKEIVRHLDVSLLAGGGFVEGKRLIKSLQKTFGQCNIESLDKTFATVATDLATGREVWFRDGDLLEAIRASIAIPGIFTPVFWQNKWLVDGGLANPVPVSLCRALGADIVIAVNLNGGLLGQSITKNSEPKNQEETTEFSLLEKFSATFKEHASDLMDQMFEPNDEPPAPGMFDVIAGSINIMQDKITRSRMAGDPPEVELVPKLSHIGLMEFDQAQACIKAGRESVQRAKDLISEQCLRESATD